MNDEVGVLATTAARMRQLQASEADWQANNPTLLDGEIAFSSDILRFKVGPGAWTALPYWGDPDAPIDGFNYGQQDGAWMRTTRYDDFTGDLNSITSTGVTHYRLVEPIQNAWYDSAMRGSFLSHYEWDNNDAIQIAHAWNTPESATHVTYQRVRRNGVWGEWYTNSGYSPEPYITSLNDLSRDGTFQISFPIGEGVADAWVTAGFGDVVTHTNIDGVTALQLGYELKAAGEPQIWMRTQTSGVWGDWYENKFGIEIEEKDITNLNRMRWRGSWIANQEYEKNDTVISSGYLAVAIADTTDSPVPTKNGDPVYILPSVPSWTTLGIVNVVNSGQAYSVPDGDLLQIVEYRLWCPTQAVGNVDWDFTMYFVDETDPSNPATSLVGSFSGAVLSDGWNVVPVTSRLLTGGTNFRFGVISQNQSDGDVFGANWVRDDNTNNGNPATGSWLRRGDNSVIRISVTDADDNPQGNVDGFLDSAKAGSDLSIFDPSASNEVFQNYRITEVLSVGDPYQFSVVPLETGPQGEPPVGLECGLQLQTYDPATTDYPLIVDHYSGDAEVSGYIKIGENAETLDQNAYGVDLKFQSLTASSDWDIAAITEGGALGGSPGEGGGGSAVWWSGTEPLEALVGDLWYRTTHPVGMYLKTDDTDSIQWVQTNGINISGDFVEVAGDTMTGNLSIPDGVADAHAVNKSQLDAAVGGVPLDQYLPLTGGTLTGALTVNNDVNIATDLDNNWINKNAAGDIRSFMQHDISEENFRIYLYDVGSGADRHYTFRPDGQAEKASNVLRRDELELDYGRLGADNTWTNVNEWTSRADFGGGIYSTGRISLSNTDPDDITSRVQIFHNGDNSAYFDYGNSDLYFRHVDTAYTARYAMHEDGELNVGTSIVTRSNGDTRYGVLGASNTWGSTQTINNGIILNWGSAASPGLRFNSTSTTTGIYVPTANQVAISLSGTQRYLFNNGTGTNSVVTFAKGDVRYPVRTRTGVSSTGDYNFLYIYTATALGAGNSIAGSNLYTAGVNTVIAIASNGVSNGTDTGATRANSTRSGSWLHCGANGNNSGSARGRIALYRRYA